MRNGVLPYNNSSVVICFWSGREEKRLFLFQNPTCCAARWHSTSYVASRTRLPQACAGVVGAAPVCTTKVLLVSGFRRRGFYTPKYMFAFERWMQSLCDVCLILYNVC